MKILFVCTGNSCRSVMAEWILRHLLQKKGKNNVQVLSAGTNAFPGMAPTLETVDVLQEFGVDASGHLSRALSPELVDQADAIFCMEDFHRDQILALQPEAAEKVHLLRTFRNTTPIPNPNIPDPIGRPKSVYQACLLTIQEGVQRVLEWLEKEVVG